MKTEIRINREYIDITYLIERDVNDIEMFNKKLGDYGILLMKNHSIKTREQIIEVRKHLTGVALAIRELRKGNEQPIKEYFEKCKTEKEFHEWAKRMDFYMEGVNILMRSAKGKPGYDYLSKIHDGLFGISGDFMIMFSQYTRAMEKRKARKEASNMGLLH